MRAIIIANGRSHDGAQARCRARDADLIIGADGGAARALAWGLLPHLGIGDMDSLSEGERAALQAHGCRFLIHPRAKDETDLELALTYAVEQGAQQIVVLGAVGGRLDHTVANLLLLALPALDGVSVRIVDGDAEALLVRGGEAVALEGERGDLVSLLPLGGDVHGVTTEGLAWALRGDTLRFGASRGVSNEMTAPVARIAVGEGYLLVVRMPEKEEGRG